jgi:hypothetical protein
MKFLVFLFSLVLLQTTFNQTASAQTAGFQNGSEITVSNVSGWARIECRDYYGRPFWRDLNCSGQVMNPDVYDYFIYQDAPKDADRVELTCTRENGETANQSTGFDAAKGISKSSFNLLISTVFQRPLLDFGKNSISYSLKKGKDEITQGSFEVNVTYLGENRCNPDTMWDNGNFYCNNPNIACHDYFQRQNWCQ